MLDWLHMIRSYVCSYHQIRYPLILCSVCLNPYWIAGMLSDRSVTRSYYRGAAGALLVYDITRSVYEIINYVYNIKHCWSLRWGGVMVRESSLISNNLVQRLGTPEWETKERKCWWMSRCHCIVKGWDAMSGFSAWCSSEGSTQWLVIVYECRIVQYAI